MLDTWKWELQVLACWIKQENLTLSPVLLKLKFLSLSLVPTIVTVMDQDSGCSAEL